MPKVPQHFEDSAGNAKPTLDRLIGVGVAAECNRTTGIPLLSQFCGKQRCGLRLVEQPALEIEAGR
jgi:hypothetical protein